MPVTLSDAIRRCRSRLDEPAYPTLPNSTPNNPGARLYTDTELTDWINECLLDISRRAEDLITFDSTVAIPAYRSNPNQPVPTYPLNLGNQVSIPSGNPQTSDILRITRVEFQLNNASNQIYPMEWAPQQYLDQVWNIDQTSNMSYPTYWTTRGYPGGTGRNQFVIQVYPQPSQAGNLNIFYYRLPIRIQDPVANPALYNATLDLIEGWDDMVIDYVQVKAYIKARNPEWQSLLQLYESKMNNIIDQTRRFTDQSTYLTYDAMSMPWQFDSWGGWS